MHMNAVPVNPPAIITLNVVLAGCFCLVLRDEGIVAYTPRLLSHDQLIGDKSLQIWRFGDYRLDIGRQSGRRPDNWPDRKSNAVFPAAEANIEYYDPLNQRAIQIELPYSESADDMRPLVAYQNPGMFTGNAAKCLEKTETIAASYVFTYRDVDLTKVRMVQKNTPLATSFLTLSASQPGFGNLFLLSVPNEAMMRGMAPGDTFSASHARYALHASGQLFYQMDLSLNVPDDYQPKPANVGNPPPGLTLEDAKLNSLVRPDGGSTPLNCYYNSIVIDPKH